MVLERFTTKLYLATLIAIIAILSQIEDADDILIVSKDVVLSKNPAFVFEFISKLEDYETVSFRIN
jgi:hypothetical protein